MQWERCTVVGSDNEKKKASTNGMKMHPHRALHEESSVTGLEKKP